MKFISIIRMFSEMDITIPLEFGKYKGLSTKEIFVGTKDIDRDLLRAYINHRLTGPYEPSEQDAITLDMFTFEVSKTIIRAVPTLDDFKGNWQQVISKLFVSSHMSYLNVITETSLDGFYLNRYKQPNDKPLVLGGIPEYIAWCIENVEGYYIELIQISILEELGVNRFIGIDVVRKMEDIYEYFPKIYFESYKFSEELIMKNNDKVPFTGRLWE